MDVEKILAELRQERDELELAIQAVQRLALSGEKRRGRPPSWMVKAKAEKPAASRRGRPPGSKNKVPRETAAEAQAV